MPPISAAEPPAVLPVPFADDIQIDPADSAPGRFHAMATPLASIFGSGFFVIVSVLDQSVGRYAVFAMAGICALAYLVGAVIRFNIREVEPILRSDDRPRRVLLLSRIAQIALIHAYVISIALYIRILSSYALGFAGWDTEFNEKALTTVVIGVILLLAVTSGLRALEATKKWALVATMAIILLLIGAFAIDDIRMLAGPGIVLPPSPTQSLWHTVTVLAGTLIVVQGFETTRYLAAQYVAPTRIRAARDSQILSSIVYLAFVACATPLMHLLTGKVADNALMFLAGTVASWLAIPLVLVAIFSQFSASVADAVGGSGSLREVSNEVIGKRMRYTIICVCAVILCWLTSTFAILALASRAFAFYYFVQCVIAFTVSRKASQKLGFAMIGATLAFITLFATPVG